MINQMLDVFTRHDLPPFTFWREVVRLSTHTDLRRLLVLFRANGRSNVGRHMFAVASSKRQKRPIAQFLSATFRERFFVGHLLLLKVATIFILPFFGLQKYFTKPLSLRLKRLRQIQGADLERRRVP
jgi:hypothetical protein